MSIPAYGPIMVVVFYQDPVHGNLFQPKGLMSEFNGSATKPKHRALAQSMRWPKHAHKQWHVAEFGCWNSRHRRTHPKIPDTKYRFLSERFPQCLCKTVPFDAVHLDKDDIEGPVWYPIAYNRRYANHYWEIAVHWLNDYLALFPSLSINPFLTISSNVLLLKVTSSVTGKHYLLEVRSSRF